jgi:hypothetical protein
LAVARWTDSPLVVVLRYDDCVLHDEAAGHCHAPYFALL